MADVRKMSRDKMLEGLGAMDGMIEAARRDWKEYVATCSRRPTKAQAERIAFLRGRLSGLCEAMTEFEKRSPLEIVGSQHSS